MTLTLKEAHLLTAIANSGFHADPDDLVDSDVWVDCVSDDARLGTATGGVMASLSQKGLVYTDGECVSMTHSGVGVFRSL